MGLPDVSAGHGVIAGEGRAELDEDFYFLLKRGYLPGPQRETRRDRGQMARRPGDRRLQQNGLLFQGADPPQVFSRMARTCRLEKIEMFFLAYYNLDSFRDFVFKSTFFDKFEVDETTKQKDRRKTTSNC